MDKKEVKKGREKLRREKIKKHELEATEIILEYSNTATKCVSKSRRANDVAKMKLEKAGIFQELIALHKLFADGQIITEKAFENIRQSFETKLLEKNVAEDVRKVISEVFQAVKKDSVRKEEKRTYPKATPKPVNVQNPLTQFMPGRPDLVFPPMPLMVPNPFVVNVVQSTIQQMLNIQNDQIRQYQANNNVQDSAATTPKLPPNPQQIPRQQHRRKPASRKQILDESATSTSSSDTSSISLPAGSALQETPKPSKRRSFDVLPVGNFLADTPTSSISLPSLSAPSPSKMSKFVCH